jgi:protein-S-isoprenylcysteine O-methyltransferase Ste14
MTLMEAHAIYALAWLSFGFGHSFLATANAKHQLAPTLGPYYRITFNALASIHLFAVWLLGAWSFHGISDFVFPNAVQSGMDVLFILGIFILVLALRGYDLRRFAGIAQIENHRSGKIDDEIEPLHTNGFHAYVRHPLYSGAYLLLWGNAQNEFGLATAIWGFVRANRLERGKPIP